MRVFWKRDRNKGLPLPPRIEKKPYSAIKKLTVENRIENLNQALMQNNIPIDAVISINETQYHINIYYKSYQT